MSGHVGERSVGARGPGSTGEPHAHPGWRTYVLIGTILTVITAVEVAVFYMPALRPVLVPILLVLSATKFALVVMFYMHLRFDSRLFSAVFVSPLLLAAFVVVALIVLFRVLGG